MTNLLAQIKRAGHLLNRPPAPKKGRKRLAPRSKKREGANREYLKLRKAFLGANPWCMALDTIINFLYRNDPAEFYKAPWILPPSTQIHHTRKPRSKYLNETSTWLAVSDWSHRWIEDHKKICREELGLLENI